MVELGQKCESTALTGIVSLTPPADMDALNEILHRLANAVGKPCCDIETDHGRWHIYEAAIVSSVALDLLRQAVALEADGALATSVVLRMLEQVPDEQQADWIDQLEPDNRAYSERRAYEIRILRRARDGALATDEIIAELSNWTVWLQLRLAHTLRDQEGLEVLSSAGRTKRIRNAADAKLRGR